MSISIHNLSKTYGKQLVLNDISFEVGAGEIVGFIGPNGAGKSTTMKIITGYVPYDVGSVEVCGLQVSRQPAEVKRLIGYLPEHNPLYLEMYVKEYLQFVGGIYKLNNLKSRIDEMIELTGLTLEYRKRIGQLSKGYRQRVGLAQALIHDPKVLILDEPTTGLDPNQLVDVRNLISQIGKEKTVILSTHIMQEVSAICDRVLIINYGNIVANEREADIVSTQNTSKNLVFIVELEREADAQLFLEIDGVLSADKLKPTLFRLESAEDIRGKIFRFIGEKGFALLTMNLQERNMEDVFHELTGRKSQ